MSIKTTRKDIIWNYAGNILNIGMNIFILPAVLSMLSSQELGLWYVFGSISALVNLMDFGFSPTIMRNITYAWSGAEEILVEGISSAELGGKPNFGLIKSLLLASRKIYLIISIIAGFLLLTIGSIYINSLLPVSKSKYLIAWLIYAIAIFLNLFYSYWSPILKGTGKIKEASQVMIMSKSIYIIFAIIGLLYGGGIICLSISYLISGLLLRILSKIYFLRIVGKNFKDVIVDERYNTNIVFNTILPNAKKQGTVTVGSWLINNANTLLCSTYLGLETTSKYGLSLQLLGVVGSFSALLFNSYIPEITSSKISKNQHRYNQIFSRAIALQWVVGIAGALFVIIIGPIVLHLVGSNSTLIPNKILILLSIILFLEQNHSTFATLISLSNTIPFVQSSIYSGIGIVILSFASFKFTNLGILGPIISQGIVQLSYNNWHWPRLALKENDTSIFKILVSCIMDIKYLFL